jgi:hypothetical protein
MLSSLQKSSIKIVLSPKLKYQSFWLGFRENILIIRRGMPELKKKKNKKTVV